MSLYAPIRLKVRREGRAKLASSEKCEMFLGYFATERVVPLTMLSYQILFSLVFSQSFFFSSFKINRYYKVKLQSVFICKSVLK